MTTEQAHIQKIIDEIFDSRLSENSHDWHKRVHPLIPDGNKGIGNYLSRKAGFGHLYYSMPGAGRIKPGVGEWRRGDVKLPATDRFHEN